MGNALERTGGGGFELVPAPGEPAPWVAALFNRWNGRRELTENSVADFVAALVRGDVVRRDGRPYAPASIASMLYALQRSILDTFHEKRDSLQFQLQVKAMTARAKAPRVDKSINDSKTYAPKEIKQLINAADKRTGALIEFAFLTGLRVSELIHVRVDDCTFMGDKVIVRVRHGKGLKERKIPVQAAIVKEVMAVYQSDTYLFQNWHPRSRNGRFTRATINRMLDRIGYEGVTPHKFRHAHATNLLRSETLKSVADRLGHSDPATTARIYDKNTVAYASLLRLDREIK